MKNTEFLVPGLCVSLMITSLMESSGLAALLLGLPPLWGRGQLTRLKVWVSLVNVSGFPSMMSDLDVGAITSQYQ